MPNADQDGFVLDEKNKNIKRRWWKRTRDRITSSSNLSTAMVTSSMSNSGNNNNNHHHTLATSKLLSSSENGNNNNKDSSGGGESSLNVLANILQRLNTCYLNLSNLKHELVSANNSSENNIKLEDKITNIISDGRQCILEGNKALNVLDSSSSSVNKTLKNKFTDDLERDGRRFNELALAVTNQFKLRKKNSTPSSTSNNNNLPNASMDASFTQLEEAKQLQMKQQQVSRMVSEVEYNEETIKARNEELHKITKLASTVNVLMKDLAQMVNEQGEDVKKINKNTSQTKQFVENAVAEVEKAETYQVEGGNCIII